MKHTAMPLTVLFILLLSSPSWCETVSWSDLVKRNDLYFEKFTDVPLTAEVSGQFNGQIKNGKKEGFWKEYHDNGQLYEKIYFKDGIRQTYEKYYKSGLLDGKGNFKHDNLDGLWSWYHENGNLHLRVTYTNGSKHGLEEWFNTDGSLQFRYRFKDGVKVE